MLIQSIEEGRKQDGNRSIADKIIKRLHDLEKTLENNQGRWVWELLQNAKDSIAESANKTVAVEIVLQDNTVRFSHNGAHFTEQDIRGLVNQISSKEIEDGQTTRKTGRFGTGFLTTHLLSKVILVKGAVETADSKVYQFEFTLDRRGKTTAQPVPRIENAWAEFHRSAKEIKPPETKEPFMTSFLYTLESKEQKEIAQAGIKEFSKLIPFVLAFIPAISYVKIVDQMHHTVVSYRNGQPVIDDIIVPIIREENKTRSYLFIARYTDGHVSIATQIEKTSAGYAVKSIEDLPKLFCDFPLIGTENFYFPVLVNCFSFNPQTERDGVWLKGPEDPEVKANQQILESAARLYKQLLAKVCEKQYSDLYNIIETRLPLTDEKYFDRVWFEQVIQTPLREEIVGLPLIETEAEETRNSIEDTWFPLKSYSHEKREIIWQFIFDLYPESVCKRSQLH